MKITQLGARSRPLSPRSASYLHAILRSALSQAVRDDLVSRNVCELWLRRERTRRRSGERTSNRMRLQHCLPLLMAPGCRPCGGWR